MPTLAELAAKLKIDAARLQDTVNTWNSYAEQKADPEFGRAAGFGYIKTPPFYAVEVVVGMYDTTGAFRINTSAQVLDVFGDGVIGAIYPGSGSAMQTCICFGRIAGRNASAESVWE
jgi:hypothetical protein